MEPVRVGDKVTDDGYRHGIVTRVAGPDAYVIWQYQEPSWVLRANLKIINEIGD